MGGFVIFYQVLLLCKSDLLFKQAFLHYVQYENSQTAKMSLIALEGLNKIVSLIEFF